jgi:hypothetical protein
VNASGELEVVGHEEHRGAVVIQPAQEVEQLCGGVRASRVILAPLSAGSDARGSVGALDCAGEGDARGDVRLVEDVA